MYKGKLVEEGNVQQVFNHPQHPYTKALLACRPMLYNKEQRLPTVDDFVNNPHFTVQAKMPSSQKNANKILLQVNDVQVFFPVEKNWLGKVLQYNKAVNGVSFNVMQGEMLGLVGESGCGKTTLGRAIAKLTNISQGSILYQDKNIAYLKNEELKAFRKSLQIVFQDPYSSLNPNKKIGEAIAEPLLVHGIETNAAKRKQKAIECLEKVGLQPQHYHRYPHEFSGGQRQRIVIARAIITKPGLIVFDESVSALDVSVQAQILNLINDLKAEFGFTGIFISHDLAVIKYIADRVIVMNKGKIEEEGRVEEVYHHPQSAYTKMLLQAMPTTPMYLLPE